MYITFNAFPQESMNCEGKKAGWCVGAVPSEKRALEEDMTLNVFMINISASLLNQNNMV